MSWGMVVFSGGETEAQNTLETCTGTRSIGGAEVVLGSLTACLESALLPPQPLHPRQPEGPSFINCGSEPCLPSPGPV